jgi:hypothetical protein
MCKRMMYHDANAALTAIHAPTIYLSRWHRFKLCSERLIRSLDDVRSFMGYSDVVVVPNAMTLLRRLLWEDTISVDSDAPEGLAAIKLHVSGMVAMGPDDRQVTFLNMPVCQ